jgi:ABC-type transport system involved in multi-copper enzyme maturation permease subunit
MKALVFKELREVFGIAVAALVGYLALVASLMGAKLFDWIPGMPQGTQGVPFTSNGFMFWFTIVSVLFAGALGFRQSAWESAQGTYLFLLHRPLSRNAIFLTKLSAGIGLFLICASVPIVVYAWWASVAGNFAGPFEWSMTAPAWQLAFLMPLLYLGAFLSGLRPARWFGTRLLPLMGSVPSLVLLCAAPSWWLLGFPVALLLYFVLVSNVCFVARVRDYS